MRVSVPGGIDAGPLAPASGTIADVVVAVLRAEEVDERRPPDELRREVDVDHVDLVDPKLGPLDPVRRVVGQRR